MPKLILSLDGVVVKEVTLAKNRATIGRRPFNDIVIDNLAVSGEHAIIERLTGKMVLKDLGSTNGTYVNGKSIRRQTLAHDDQIEIGRYQIQYLEDTGLTADAALDKPDADAGADDGTHGNADGNADGSADSHAARAENSAPPTDLPPTLDGDAIEGPRVRVLNGASAGKSLALTKVVTTIGKPGISVASITLRGHGYDLAHVTGSQVATANGIPASEGPITLRHLDRIEVGDVQLEFLDH